MINNQHNTSVFPMDKKHSRSRVINVYTLILAFTPFLASINAYLTTDYFSFYFLLASSAAISVGFVFNWLKYYDFTKSYILIIISFVIFFYVSYDAAQSGAYLYYFPLTLAIVNIYDFEIKKDRISIFMHFLLNGILIAINILTDNSLFTSDFVSTEMVNHFFTFNLIFSILCMGYFIYLIIYMNISQKQLINTLTNEMMRSKTFEESKKTSNDILFAELQHRLKNNLSLINSLLRLKMEKAVLENLEEKINEAAHAIQIVADANRFVIFKDDTFCVPTEVYFNGVLDSWVSFKNNKKDDFKLELENYEINIKQAVPLALILHETFASFCKHQKEANTKHYLNINLTQRGILRLESSMDDFLETCLTSEQLFQILVEQIDAEIAVIDKRVFEVRYENNVENKTIESASIFA